MKLKLVSCEVLEREAVHCLDETSFEIDIEYTKKEAHEKPELLQKSIQEIIRLRSSNVLISLIQTSWYLIIEGCDQNRIIIPLKEVCDYRATRCLGVSR